MVTKPLLALTLIASLAACGGGGKPTADSSGAATSHTVDANAAVAAALPLADQQDFEDARRGLVASEPDPWSEAPDGAPIWDAAVYAFVDGDAPASVNPSLWRQAKLNDIHGLFKVTDGVYQVRGYDLSNMSLIRGRSGWIVVDPLTARETAARGARPRAQASRRRRRSSR